MKKKELPLADFVPLWRTLREDDVTALVTPSLDYVGGFEVTPLDVRFASGESLAGLGEQLRFLDPVCPTTPPASPLGVTHTTSAAHTPLKRLEGRLGQVREPQFPRSMQKGRQPPQAPGTCSDVPMEAPEKVDLTRGTCIHAH